MPGHGSRKSPPWAAAFVQKQQRDWIASRHRSAWRGKPDVVNACVASPRHAVPAGPGTSDVRADRRPIARPRRMSGRCRVAGQSRAARLGGPIRVTFASDLVVGSMRSRLWHATPSAASPREIRHEGALRSAAWLSSSSVTSMWPPWPTRRARAGGRRRRTGSVPCRICRARRRPTRQRPGPRRCVGPGGARTRRPPARRRAWRPRVTNLPHA